MTTPEVLRAGADLIEEKGWWKNGEPSTGKNICAGLAVCQIEYSPSKRQDVIRALAVTTGMSPSLCGFYQWNDAQPSGQVVCQAMRDCADHLEKIAVDSNQEPS